MGTQARIYSIRSYQTDKIYIGSTCQSLSMRMGGHRKNFKAYNNQKSNYVSSFEILKFDDAYIELIENYPCLTKDELHKREGEHIRANECVNKVIPGRSDKEYYQDNKEKYKEYRQDNNDIIKEYNIQYYKDNIIKEKVECVCGSMIPKNTLSKHCKSKKHFYNFIHS